MKNRNSILAFALAVACLFAGATFAQDKAKDKGKAMTFRGKIEAVTQKGLTVNGERVEGWMDAMTMDYPVDRAGVLKKVKVGDRIVATVYQGDLTLHDIKVIPPADPAKQKSK